MSKLKLNLPSAPLLDLRRASDYQQGHLQNASHFPVDELEDRLHELPTKPSALNIFGTQAQIEQAQILLHDKGYQVASAIECNEALLTSAATHGLLEQGTRSKQLWQANFLLTESIDLIESKVQGRKGLDLGCGSGRDLIFLSQRGWKMTGVDYSNNSLDKLRAFALRNQLNVQCVCEDLEQEHYGSSRFQADLILVMRYLHRPLLGMLREWLSPGGILVYQTFLEAARFHGKPKNPKFLLKQSELGQRFSDFDILIDRQDRLRDGRPVASFVAQKR